MAEQRFPRQLEKFVRLLHRQEPLAAREPEFWRRSSEAYEYLVASIREHRLTDLQVAKAIPLLVQAHQHQDSPFFHDSAILLDLLVHVAREHDVQARTAAAKALVGVHRLARDHGSVLGGATLSDATVESVLETTLSRGLRTNGATVFTLAYLEDLRRRRGDGADDDLHRSLLLAVLSGHVPDDRDALLWMALLHTHEIHLRPGSWKTRPDVSVAAPVTERTAAAAVAALFPASDPRSGYVHWYFAYRALGYQVVSDIPPADLERVYALREWLSQDPRVTGVVPED